MQNIALAIVAAITVGALTHNEFMCAEQHTVTFVNDCGYGTPYLWSASGQLLSTGGAITFTGAELGLLAYLQTGSCGNNGEGCTTVSANLSDGDSCATVSSVSEVVRVCLYNDTSDLGQQCPGDDCSSSGGSGPLDDQACCSADNVDLEITFCL